MSIEREIRRRRMAEAMKENGMRARCRKCGTRMTAKNALGWVCEKCGWESEKQKRIRRELYEPTGNVLYVNDNRNVYPEYLPKYEMTPIHLSVSNELISCDGDIGEELADDDYNHMIANRRRKTEV